MSFLDQASLTRRMAEELARDDVVTPVRLPKSIPAGRYTDPAFFSLEIEALKGSWVFGIHGDEVPEVGSFFRWSQLGQSLLFTRDRSGQVRCFHNICRHRANTLVHEDCGQRRNFICPVHGWTFGLDGALTGVRERRDIPDMDLSAHSLKEVRCESLGQLYFINLDGRAKPLLDDLGEVGREWMRYRPDQSRLVRRLGMTVNANYKVVQEANMEVYHVNTVHPAIVNEFLDSSAAPIELYPNGHSIQAARLKQKNWTENPVPLAHAPEAEACSQLANIAFNTFPNRVCAMNAWGYSMQSYWPVDVGTTYVEVYWIAPKSTDPGPPALWDEIVKTFNVVLQQDFVFCSEAQKNLESGAVSEVLTTYQERALYHAHQELDRRIGRERIPAGLRLVQ